MNASGTLALVNRVTGQTIASAVELATTRRSRRRGLLGRRELDPSAALILSPCCAIHTAFMRFGIDVAFVDACGRVVRIVRDLPPWRLAWSLRAHAVVEFSAGSLRLRDVLIGDVLDLAPAVSPAAGGPASGAAAEWAAGVTWLRQAEG